MPDQGTTSCGQHILIPVNVRPIRQLKHKAIIHRLHNDRRLILVAAAPPNVPNECEGPTRTACNPSRQRIKVVFKKVQELRADVLFTFHEYLTLSSADTV